VVLISSLFIQKMKNKNYLIPLLIVYAFCSFLMDAFILDFINLPI
jgi:hypothetical protein